MKIGNKVFDVGKHTYVMGILNMTPDSFSDGGIHNNIDSALYRVGVMIGEGATIIDVGGESTRPGYDMISDDEELSRIIPIIEAINNNYDITISVDTYKSKVAREAIDSGASLVNDIWGLKYDGDMADVIVQKGVAVCIMHNSKNQGNDCVVDRVIRELQDSIDIAISAGIVGDNIIIDPGIGFAKTYHDNLEIMKNLHILHKWGYPLLLGISRKSIIGNTLNNSTSERAAGTIALNAYGVINGCSFIRVHDIKDNMDAIKMIEAVRYC